MGTVLAAAKGQLDVLMSAQTKFASGLTSATPAAPVDSALQDFYTQQTALLQGLPVALQAQLSPADWTALQSFLSRELVAKLHVGVINNARPK
jgi:hypothetical protein